MLQSLNVVSVMWWLFHQQEERKANVVSPKLAAVFSDRAVSSGDWLACFLHAELLRARTS